MIGNNDFWYILYLEQYPNSEVEVFNRWGKKVYESPDYKNDWDGTNFRGGSKLKEGTYFYVINIAGFEEPMSGTVTLLR